jgi:hypothetical protein
MIFDGVSKFAKDANRGTEGPIRRVNRGKLNPLGHMLVNAHASIPFEEYPLVISPQSGQN